MHPLLEHTAHRPFPLPHGPWIMKQKWHDLLFAHWAIEPAALRPNLPEPLRPYLDTFDGKAWVGVIPFWMSNVQARWLPMLPTASRFPELNVRTYLTIEGKPGVYFFSLDATSRLAVWGARIGFSLPYYRARMVVLRGDKIICGSMSGELDPRILGEDHEEIGYQAQRLNKTSGQFVGRYEAINLPHHAAVGSIEYFLVERYCLYTTRGKRILRCTIHHLPWTLQLAGAALYVNTIAHANGIALPDGQPLLHYAQDMEVLVWTPEAVNPAA